MNMGLNWSIQANMKSWQNQETQLHLHRAALYIHVYTQATHTHLVSPHNKHICKVTKLGPLTYFSSWWLRHFSFGFLKKWQQRPSNGNACKIVDMHGCQHHVTNLHMWVLDAWRWSIGILDYMLTWDQIYSRWTTWGSCETCKLFALSMPLEGCLWWPFFTSKP